MKKIYFGKNAIVKKYGYCQKQSKKKDMEEVEFGGPFGKVRSKGKEPLKNLAIGAAIGAGFIGLSAGVIWLVKRDLYKSKRAADAKFEDSKADSQIKVIKARAETAKEAAKQAQLQAEQEDPELKLKKQDKEVKFYVFNKLGLDQTNTPAGEPVYARRSEEKGYSRPRLVGKLVSKGDICVLVSEPGAGKSVLAFQMADDIAEGRESKLFHMPEGHQPPQPVYYWDAEMDSDDMRERYPEGLSDNLVRFSHCNYRDGFHLLKHIYDTVSPLSSDATIVLDNWKALCARIDAFYFFTGLRNLQAQFEQRNTRLTVILVIHTTKEAIKKCEVDLGDVAGAAQITQAAKNVLFVNPTGFEGCVELHDAKHRTTKKKKENRVVLRGGEGNDENLHFEALENVMDGEEIQKLTKDLDDGSDTPKKPGRPRSLSDEDAVAIAERLDNGESVKDLADEYHVAEGTIRSSAKPNRRQ